MCLCTCVPLCIRVHVGVCMFCVCVCMSVKETGLSKRGRKCESETKIIFYIVILNVGSFFGLCHYVSKNFLFLILFYFI